MEIEMGIIKFEVRVAEAVKAIEEVRKQPRKVFEALTTEVKSAVSGVLNQLLAAEMTFFLGQPDQTQNKRNGYYERDFALKGIGCVRIKMPLDRQRKFQSELVQPHEQIDPRLKEDLALLHLSGISTRLLALLSKRILGVEVSADTVSKSLRTIEDQASLWLRRPIAQKYWALFVDGTNFRVQRRGSTQKEPSLVVVGIDERNCLSILACEPGTKDNVSCWETVFEELIQRGFDSSSVRLGIMDGLPGLEKLFRNIFPNALTQRCWVHALRNAMNKTPGRLSDSFKVLAQKVMYATNENQARVAFSALKLAMNRDAQRAVECLEKDLDSLLTHYRFDQNLWLTLKTTNPIERVNKELKRRVKSMETIGEKTLETLIAFTAMRLEYYWQITPIQERRLQNLTYVKPKMNQIETTMDSLTQMQKIEKS